MSRQNKDKADRVTATRLEHDQEQRYLKWRDERGLSDAQAGRRLIARGLEYTDIKTDRDEMREQNQELREKLAARDDRATVRNVGTVAGAAVIMAYFTVGSASFVGAALALWTIVWGWWPSLTTRIEKRDEPE